MNEEIQKEIEELDKIDLTGDIEDYMGTDVYSLKEEVQSKYDIVLDYMYTEDFAEYLNHKYHTDIYETIKYIVRRKDIKDE